MFKSIRLFSILVLFCMAGLVYTQTIHDVAMKGQLDSVKIYLAKDSALLEASTTGGERPLHMAAYAGQTDVMEYLLDQGADVDACTDYQYTPLHYTAFSGNVNAANMLLDHGADVDSRHIEKSTALHLAAQQGKMEILKCLMEHGADVNAVDFYGYTALDMAVDFARVESIKYLEDHEGRLTPIPDVDIKPLGDQLYRLDFPWGQSTNIIVQTGSDGLLLVDSGFSKRINDKLSDIIAGLGEGDVEWIINTHHHWDHISGNAIARDPSGIIKLANLDSLTETGMFKKVDLKSSFFKKCYQFKFNGQTIQIIPFPGIHTNADMLIYFPQVATVHMGDLLISESFPSVRNRVDDYLDFLLNAMKFFPRNTIFVCGHGRECTWDDVRDYHAMLTESARIIRAERKKGRTHKDIQREKCLAQFAKWNNFIPILNSDYWLNAVYNTDLAGQSK
ncbi:ankyrin repeat domain-containing protein [bacterium]|nr:ankyrin repeat domain-containing protein [bacterium]